VWVTFEGRWVRLEPLNADAHCDALWSELEPASTHHLWRYLFDGPYLDRASFHEALEKKSGKSDPCFYAIVNRETERAQGYASFMRTKPAHRVIEVGGILFTPPLQGTRRATEAMYLMARHVFEELGYRRYEWKCDSRNEPSRRAAERLGFQFEAIFRQHMLVKGENRDTAWYSMLDTEWPERKVAFEKWLEPGNFDENGRQKVRLSRHRVPAPQLTEDGN
jgi:RimJ/RimL family protein N-acetyltransferase